MYILDIKPCKCTENCLAIQFYFCPNRAQQLQKLEDLQERVGKYDTTMQFIVCDLSAKKVTIRDIQVGTC